MNKIHKAPKTPVDYALRGGLRIFDHQNQLDQELSQAELRQRSLAANNNIKTVADPEAMVIDLGDDRQLTAQLFNRGVSEDLIIYNYAWNGHYGPAKGDGPVSDQHEADHIAAAFPDKQLLVINQPGFGGSDVLPPEIAKQLAETGDYSALGKYIGERLKTHLKTELGHLATVGVYGESQGALRAAGYAGQLAEVADRVRLSLVDPTGSKKHSLLGLAYAYAAKEGLHTIGYRHAAHEIDPISAAKRRESAKFSNFLRDKVFKRKASPPGSAKAKQKPRPLDTLRSLAQDGLETNLGNLVGSGVDRVDVYSPELSEISDSQRLRQISLKLGETALDIRHFVVAGVTHAFTKGKPVVPEVLIGRLFDDGLEPEAHET